MGDFAVMRGNAKARVFAYRGGVSGGGIRRVSGRWKNCACDQPGGHSGVAAGAHPAGFVGAGLGPGHSDWPLDAIDAHSATVEGGGGKNRKPDGSAITLPFWGGEGEAEIGNWTDRGMGWRHRLTSAAASFQNFATPPPTIHFNGWQS